MITINLLPQELRRKQAPKIVLPEIPIKKTLILGGAIFLAVQLFFTLITGYVIVQTRLTSSAIRSLKEKNGDLQKTKAKIEGAQTRLRELRAATSRSFYWASLLNSLSNSMTKGVWLRNLSVEEHEISIPKENAATTKPGAAPKTLFTIEKTKVLKLEGSVIAAGQETAFIGKFLQSLKQNAYFAALFQDIELSGMNQRKIKEFDVYDFLIVCKFKKEKMP